MGQSADAILFYGYCWEEEGSITFGEPVGTAVSEPVSEFDEDEEKIDPDQDQPDWDEIILKRRGGSNPWDSFPHEEARRLKYLESRAFSDKWTEEHRAELDAYYAGKKAIKKEFGVDVRTWGSDQGGCPMLYVDTSYIHVDWEAPKEITPDMFTVLPDWDDKLTRFAAEFNIELPQTSPRWWLVTYLG